jgi:hypothetical protein
MRERIKALALSRHAMELLNQEIERLHRNMNVVGTPAQLATCKQQLQEMIRQLESDCLPPKNQRLFGMGHMIADSWPIDSELGDALLRAEQAYRAAK